jgi:hypothetical protein
LELGTVGAIQSPSSSSSHSSGFSASEYMYKWTTQPKHLKIPTGVRDTQGLIVEPTFRLLGFLVENLIGCILIPVIGLLGIRVWDTFGIHPIFGLLVLRIINLGGRVDWRIEILEDVTTINAFTVDQDVISIIIAGIMLAWWRKRVRKKTDCRTSVYRLVVFSIEGLGGEVKCFSSYSPVFGFLWRKMKWS